MSDLAQSRRLVIKVGSTLLVNEAGHLNRDWLATLADDIAELTAQGKQVLVVSSGAIAIGSSILGINRRRARLEELQAAAAAGQVQLVQVYQELLAKHQVIAAQVLLTPDDTENRRRFLNARSTLQKLLDCAVVPIINENDTVATEEIRYGDNDRLAARVAQMTMADTLILLSDVAGLHSADPGKDPSARLIAEVDSITEEIVAMADGSSSALGSGGMRTKIQAAQIATHAGCATVIASGKVAHPIAGLLGGGPRTEFRASGSPTAARKQWIAGLLEVSAALQIDAGAAAALRKGKSLLPAGLTAVRGEFSRGDVVSVQDEQGNEMGRGLAEYSSDDAKQLQGCQSADIEQRLGYRGRPVLLHRDELVIY